METTADTEIWKQKLTYLVKFFFFSWQQYRALRFRDLWKPRPDFHSPHSPCGFCTLNPGIGVVFLSALAQMFLWSPWEFSTNNSTGNLRKCLPYTEFSVPRWASRRREQDRRVWGCAALKAGPVHFSSVQHEPLGHNELRIWRNY